MSDFEMGHIRGFQESTFFVRDDSARAIFLSGISGDDILRKSSVPKSANPIPLVGERFFVCGNVRSGQRKKAEWVKCIFRGIFTPPYFFSDVRKRTVLAVSKRNKNKYAHRFSTVVLVAPQGRRISTIPHLFSQKKPCKNNQKSLTYFFEIFVFEK